MTDADERITVGLIGKRLGRYLIQAELGRGGMATVYRARDPQLGRDVALKVMHTFFTGRPELDARFRREAKAVAAIRHPSILAVFDSAPPTGEEPAYIVSEIIEGPSLRRLADSRGGRFLPEAAALLAIPVAEALAAAHAAGIVHRDVKPDNVLIDRAGGGVRVVLTDFGVAHVSGLETMTATGALVGSPAYMSPEQARGDDVRPESDVFSLGVMLYQLATGRLPFPGKDPLSMVAAVLRGEFLRPSQVDPHVGPDLERVIVRCLAQKPADRFAGGAPLAAALREALGEAALGDEAAALRRSVDDGPAFEQQLAPRIARVALAAAERARRKGAVPRAIAEIGRALAYQPDSGEARDLLARVGKRQRLRSLWRVGGAGVAALGIAAAVVVGAGRIGGRRQPDHAAPAVIAAGATAAVTSPAAAPASAASGVAPPPAGPSSAALPRPAVEPPIPVVAKSDARSEAKLTRRPRRASPHAPPLTIAAVPVPVPAAAPAPAAAEPPPPVVVEAPPAPPAAATEAATATLVLRASHAFCEPSLDDRPASLRARYEGLAPGRHEIFCTIPQGGPKVHVASYEIQPGTKPSLVIVPGPDGRPTLRRPD